jgi:hypothetical protein
MVEYTRVQGQVDRGGPCTTCMRGCGVAGAPRGDRTGPPSICFTGNKNMLSLLQMIHKH